MPLTLTCHPDCPANAISVVTVEVDYSPSGSFTLRYNVHGSPDLLALPEPATPDRTDDLWQKTCFEAFVGVPGAPGYLELNLSPSGKWAVYLFESYREGMSNPGLVSAPMIETVTTADRFELAASVDLGGLPIMEGAKLEMALTAVVEEKNGRKSLWALNHGLGNPDFHNRDCFTHKLEVAVS